MPVFFEYLLKFSISLGAVYLFYILVLQRLTFYNWNRRYLLFYLLLCFFIPFTNLSGLLSKSQLDNNKLINSIPVFNFSGSTATVAQAANDHSSSLYYWQWGLVILLIGSFLLLLRLAVQYFSFLKMRNAAELLNNEEVKLYRVKDKIIPFSFNNSIFINHEIENTEELKEIIRHEFVHVKQKHTIDILFAELLCIINWYNPFVWLMRKAIRQNLEFIADNNVLQSGFDRKQYQYLLLKIIGVSQFSITQQFNFSSLKKRIAMMNKLKSAKVHLIKFLFALPLTAILLLAFRDKINRLEKSTKEPVVKNAGIIIDVSTKDPIEGVAEAYNKNIAIVDTPPPAPLPQTSVELNDKGYLIDIIDRKGNCTVVVKDKNQKEVKRLLLTEWNKNEKHYESLYGQIPPPPPPPPQVLAPAQSSSPTPALAPTSPAPAVAPAPAPMPPAKPREQRAVSSDAKNKNYMVLEVPAKPLYMVDGKEMTATENLDAINPADIARVDVLKDKAATEKYGTKGKNGVVKITTKKNIPVDASAEIVEVREVPVARVQVAEVPVDAAEIREVAVDIAEVRVAPITKINGKADHVETGESKLPADAMYYIDDVPAARKQVDQLDPASIQSIDVIKNKATEKNTGTKHIIKIATKKKIAV
jgi:TonB-dependent SusC/RagA subfamily outer membrane receptor